jgi:hypothetical protein
MEVNITQAEVETYSNCREREVCRDRARQSELERKEGRERKGGQVAECRSGGRHHTVGHMNLKYA